MNDQDHHQQPFPKLPLYAAAALIGMTLLLVTLARTTGIGSVRTPQAAVVAERHLRFQDQADGGISVRDATTGQLIDLIEPGSNGFLRGTLRGLGRERKRQGIGPEPALRLTGRSDGRLLLEDPHTDRLIDLGSFGPTNAAVFAHLLTADGSDDLRVSLQGSSGAVVEVKVQDRDAPSSSPHAARNEKPS